MSTTALEIKVPFIVTCQVTGLQKAYTSKEFVARKIANYGGDVQAMLDTYVCKDAKKLLKAGKSVAEVITALGGTKDPATVDLTKLVLVKKVKVKAAKPEVTPEAPATGETASTETTASTEGTEVKAAAKTRKPRAKKAKSEVAAAPTGEAPAADATPAAPAEPTSTESTEQPATA